MFFDEATCGVSTARGAENVAGAMRAAFGSVVIHSDSDISYYQRVVRDSRFAVAETIVQGCVASVSDKSPFLAVVDLSGGGSQAVQADASLWYRSNETPFLFPLSPKRVLWENVHLRQILLNGEAVDSVLAEQGIDPIRLLRLESAPTSIAALAQWKAVAAHARVFAASASFVDAPLSRAAVFRLLVAALVDAFAPPESLFTQSTSPSAGSTAVARALEHIRQHAGEDLTVSAIAAAAGVSVRALQRAFSSQLGQRPLEVLRAERLRRAREELLHAGPDSGSTVRSVASRWGFAHPGRFAAAYAAAFGHSPAADLQR